MIPENLEKKNEKLENSFDIIKEI
ncbi:hypothetical protein LCGC14_3111250, partial [marine sediment metagenome]